MKNLKRIAAAALIIGLVAIPATASAIGTSVGLGRADSYAVLAGETITNTGPTVITGDLGLHPGSAVTGFPPGLVSGTQHVTDAAARRAKIDLVTAYDDAANQATDFASPPDIGGLTLVPGVYTSSSTLFLTGTVTLDAGGDPNAVWIFQVGSALTTASNSTVAFINGAQPCNVFWQVGSSATIGTNTTFVGTIMALTSITANTGATIDGRALARNGSVTLDSNVITQSVCTIFVPPTAPPTVAPTVVPTVAPTAPPTVAPVVTQAPTVAPVVTQAPTVSANPAASAAVTAIPAALITPSPTDVPVAVISEAPETATTVNGPRILIEEGTPDVTLPPTDTSPLGGNDGNAQNFGGVLVLLGGLLVLAAAVIARLQPARR